MIVLTMKSTIVSLLSTLDNSNLRWHHAIDCLKTAENFIAKLSESPLRSICIIDMVSTGYIILEIIKKIPDYQFFYGMHDYKAQVSASLPTNGFQKSLKDPRFAIDVDSLLYLCCFFEKINRIHTDKTINNVSDTAIFSSDYFKNATKDLQISGFTTINMRVVFEYIDDFNKNSR